jgi:MFS family permease
MFVAVFGYADLHLFALLATEIKASFGLSDTQVGVVQGLAGGLSSALALIPVGILVDKVNRVRLLIGAAALWSLFTLFTGLSHDFWQMLASRIGVGVAEAAVYPAAYSLIADLYAPKRRALAISIFLTGTIAGASAATTLSGMLIHAVQAAGAVMATGVWALPAWRKVFLAAALPGVALLLGLALTREPARHGEDAEIGVENEQTFLQFVSRERALLSRLIGAIVLSQVVLAPIFGWLPAAFIRIFRFSPGQAGEWFGVIFGAGALTGIGVGTALVSVFNRRDEAGAPLAVLKIGLLLSAVTILAIPLAESAMTLALATTVLIASVYVGMTVTPTLLVAVAPNHLRGRLIALETLVLLTTMAITPPLVGVLSDRVFVGSRGLVQAIGAITIPCSLVAPFLLFGVAGLIARLRDR